MAALGDLILGWFTLESGVHATLAGFANAGLSFQGRSPADLLLPVPIGVVLGLYVGKHLGVFCAAMAVTRLGWADMPRDASIRQLYGVAVPCGIGFTLGLLIDKLAFSAARLIYETKIGVLTGSLAAALLDLAALRGSKPDTSAR